MFDQTRSKTYTLVGVIVVVVIVALLYFVYLGTDDTGGASTAPEDTTINTGQNQDTGGAAGQSGNTGSVIQQQKDVLHIDILTPGKVGQRSQAGDTLVVHYVGTFEDGTLFDSSRERGVPFEFTLGAHQVIQGWDVGMQDMEIGEVRKLTIAPELGYGSRQVGPIPPNTTLIFEVELLEIK